MAKIFGPFTTPIYYEHIDLFKTSDELKDIVKKGRSNHIFKSEFEKRKNRAVALGKDFRDVAGYEAVWIDLTLKLRQWALFNQYDSFVYKNLGEDEGKDAYVTLTQNQVPKAEEVYKFNKDKYLDTVLPIIQEHIHQNYIESKRNKESVMKQHDTYWAGHNPLSFWEPR